MIKFQNDADVERYNLLLQVRAENKKVPMYSINSAEDLRCYSNWLSMSNGGELSINDGPGGSLYDFLQANKNGKAILLVNWNNFTNEELVKFNSVIDEKAKVDGVEMGDNIKVIGLYNTEKENAYKGSDFYSRFNLKKKFQCGADAQKEYLEIANKYHKQSVEEKIQMEMQMEPVEEKMEMQKEVQKNKMEVIEVDLFGSDSDWKGLLFGNLTIDQNGMRIKQSEFTKNLINNKQDYKLIIKNPPKNNKEFERFWNEAINLKKINLYNHDHSLPGNFQMEMIDDLKKADDFEGTIIHDEDVVADVSFVLNSITYDSFFGRFKILNDKNQLITYAGILEENKNKTIEILITEELKDLQYQRFLEEASKHNVKLKIVEKNRLKDIKKDIYIEIIAAKDAEHDIAKRFPNSSERIIIDVSEMTLSDLLGGSSLKVEAAKDEKKNLEFQYNEGLLINLLKNDNNNIILKGKFSQEVINGLSELVLTGKIVINGEEKKFLNLDKRLHLYPDNKNAFNFVAVQQLNNPEKKEKASMLNVDENAPYLNKSYAQIEAIQRYQKVFKNQDPENFWYGLNNIDSQKRKINLQMEKVILNDQYNPKEFQDNRLKDVEQILGVSPYCFIAGETGVGKSSFVEKVLGKKAEYKVYTDEIFIEKWAQNKEDKNKIKVLFLDEANISPTDYSKFETLFNKPPGIVVNGEYIELTENHKVIFASNPLSYGGKRHLAGLFKEHGGSVVFENMPPDFLYYEVVKPILQNTKMPDKDIKEISEILLSVYQFCNQFSGDKIILTARALKEMALNVAAAHKNDKNIDLKEVAQYYAYIVAKSKMPPRYVNQFDDWFNQKIATLESVENVNQKIHSNKCMDNEEFICTPSRLEAQYRMEDLLKLREFKKSQKSEELKSGGLSGIILEGEPGTGKSELALAVLKQCKYKRAEIVPEELKKVDIQSLKYELPQNFDPTEKRYYHIPANWSFETKAAVMIKAYHEGAVVLIDEANTGPQMEQMINELLDPHKCKAPLSGFTLIATQNPSIMSGRSANNEATMARMYHVDIPPYNEKEMSEILQKKFPKLTKDAINTLINEYKNSRSRGEKINFRDMVKFCDKNENKMMIIEQQCKVSDLSKSVLSEPNVNNPPICNLI